MLSVDFIHEINTFDNKPVTILQILLGIVFRSKCCLWTLFMRSIHLIISR